MMQNFLISFNEEANDLQFEEYFFNGFPRPYDIAFKYDEFINIEWKFKNELINNNKIKYIVQMKRENDNDNFDSISEGNDLYNKMDYEMIHIYKEFRICLLYNNIVCSFSKIINIKDNISIILSELENSSKYVKLILEWSGYKYMQLIYSGNRDGSSSKIFHEKCNDKGSTITLYKNDKGNIFGGYSSISWSSCNGYVNDNKSFIFTLTNIYNIPPKILKKDLIINQDLKRGPTFCFQGKLDIDTHMFISISENFKTKLCTSDFQGEKGKSIFTGQKSNNLKIIEIEVFKLIN